MMAKVIHIMNMEAKEIELRILMIQNDIDELEKRHLNNKNILENERKYTSTFVIYNEDKIENNESYDTISNNSKNINAANLNDSNSSLIITYATMKNFENKILQKNIEIQKIINDLRVDLEATCNELALHKQKRKQFEILHQRAIDEQRKEKESRENKQVEQYTTLAYCNKQ